MQDQVLTEFQNSAGIIREPIGVRAESYWYDADKIRFRFGRPELMGGWLSTAGANNVDELLGQPRILQTVRARTGARAAVIGTEIGLFASNLSQYKNVTPIVTVVVSSDILNTTAGSTDVIASVSNHGLTNNTLVGVVSANTTIGGNILLNVTATTTALFQISVIDSNSFAIPTPTTATDTSVATGGSISLILHLPAMLANRQTLGGWGGGVWDGPFGWDEPTGDGIILDVGLWSMDVWGTEVMAVPSGGGLYLYSPQNGIYSNFALVTAAPSVNNIVRTAVEARHVILYGTHDLSGVFDPLLIRWCSQEDYDDWTPTLTNTAGDFPLNSTGTQIIGVEKIRDQYVIFTDHDIFTQAYIGGNDVFGFARAGANCGLIGRNAAIEHAGVMYWASNNGQFYKYDGRVQALDCTVLRYVYDNLNPNCLDKIYAGTISQFSELIWLYTSKDSPNEENDRYVIYNPVENHWTIGSIYRNVWLDRSTYDQILAAPAAGDGLYYHEVGQSADTSTLEAFLESESFDLEDGDRILFCNKIVPEILNPSGEPSLETINVFLKAKKYPSATEQIVKGPFPVTGTTRKVSMRIRGRELTLRLESSTQTRPDAEGSGKWRLSSMRLGIQPDGKR